MQGTPFVRTAAELVRPLDVALLPLAGGLARRALARAGVETRECRAGGALLSYYDAPARTPGGGPPIVLVHGLADNALTWALLLPALAEHADVYALDLPGYGLSPLRSGHSHDTIGELEQIVSGFVSEVVKRPALVVGNSMGGWIGARIALHNPQHLSGLVLLNPGGAPLQGRASWQPFVELCRARNLRDVRTIYRRMFGLVLPPLYLAQHGFQERFTRKVVQAFMDSVDEHGFLTAASLQTLGVPVALIWGLKDRFLPDGSLEFFRNNLPGARTLYLPHVGHLPQRERPGTVARFIKAFQQDLRAQPQ